MAEPLVINIGTTGLVESDLAFRYYENGVANVGTASALTTTDLTGGDYAVNGLPDAAVDTWHLVTWSYGGIDGFYHYRPKRVISAPPNIIVPVRVTGLNKTALDLTLYKDAVEQNDVLTATEIGSPGDYRVTGYPSDEAGDWLLVWRYLGFSFNYSWKVAAVSTRYLQIKAVDSPIDLGPDTNNRTVFSMNFETLCAADSGSVESDISSLISDASLGTLWTDMFYGKRFVIPTGDGPYMRVLATGGPAPLETHDGSEYERPTVQVTVTGKSYNTTRTRAYAIWRALKGMRNTTVAA